MPVEAYWSIGKVERYHAPIRRAFDIFDSELGPSITDEAKLQMACKAVNDTAGPDGLVPTLLVFGAYPRLVRESPPLTSTAKRAKAIEKAITTIRKLRAERDIANALIATKGLVTNELLPAALPIGSEVLVYREKEG